MHILGLDCLHVSNAPLISPDARPHSGVVGVAAASVSVWIPPLLPPAIPQSAPLQESRERIPCGSPITALGKRGCAGMPLHLEIPRRYPPEVVTQALIMDCAFHNWLCFLAW